MNFLFRRAGAVRVATLLLAICTLVLPVAPASGAPAAPAFGPMIETAGLYDPQTMCSPNEKPGVRAFRKFVLSQYPDTGAGGISRACSSGGTSEHKEGRAWDWGVSARDPVESAAADELIAWLLAPDEYGNDIAMARRAGIMYLIWNRKIWSTWAGWETYCVRKKNVGCVKPGTDQVRHPHTDHVHFSFTWAGAKRKTTFYKPDRSFVTEVAAAPSGGYWFAGRNGGVAGFGAPVHGDRVGKTKKFPVVDLLPSARGEGYYLLAANGRVSSFGDAVFRGNAFGLPAPAVALAETPSGEGYLVLAADGTVAVFGDGVHQGDAAGAPEPAVAILPAGTGYRIVFSTGRVASFGAADLTPVVSDEPVTDAAAHGTGGYWLLGASGGLTAVGDAPDFGSADALGTAVSVAATTGGDGLWVVTDIGALVALGAAPVLGDLAP